MWKMHDMYHKRKSKIGVLPCVLLLLVIILYLVCTSLSTYEKLSDEQKALSFKNC